MLHWPVVPVGTASLRALPEPGATPVIYEMKWDGFRTIIWRNADGVRVQSRHGTDLTAYFPDLVGPLTAALPPRAVLDGELLVWDPDRGRCSFGLLQRRLVAGRRIAEVSRKHPAHLVAFDLLRDGRGTELLDQPLSVRRAKLERMLRTAPPQLVLCPQTAVPAVARGWMQDLGTAGIEGVVIKKIDERYRPGTRSWTKVRTRDTAEYVVGGVTGTVDHPVTLLLGRYDRTGTLRYTGQTHPVRPEHRADLAAVLHALVFRGPQAGHPWPIPLPTAWTARFNDRRPLTYTPVEPTAVVEVEVDTAIDGPFGRARHGARLIRVRMDLRPADITLEQTASGDRVGSAAGR
ncbi:ATP dependent DNA ligase [Actinoplanes sp. SE50]|uniref:ATP-dependent DNA ligase n=1 Tax=unclassified Actinoplanes TaxID=2626549 RepID=UPI00023ED693|nr:MULTISPECIES: ATP-dependent DNA ligase [unclassified Actinoplanes]AEV86808.1 ATP dependent DNA ligase [Actinoplanes sp. SE50/110]ATO85205.1 ATP dependent DNA ligase [Actinoplanes sp. SE50]SLM02615.1 ATP-dependent DNA ligase [Actinoplanes sp. SE50/110]